MTPTRFALFVTAFTATVNPAFAQDKNAAAPKPDSCHVVIVKERTNAITDKDSIANLFSVVRYMADPSEDVSDPDKAKRVIDQTMDEINHRGESLSESIGKTVTSIGLLGMSVPKANYLAQANDPVAKTLSDELVKDMKALRDHRETRLYYLEADCVQPMEDAYQKLEKGKEGSYRPALLGTAERIPGTTTFTFKPNAPQQ